MDYGTYADLATLKGRLSIPDAQDDRTLLLLLQGASRWADRYCGRHFYPRLAVRYYEPDDEPSALWIDDLLALREVAIDADGYRTYGAVLGERDYDLWPDGEDQWPKCRIELTGLGAYSRFPRWRRSVRLTGWWGYGDGTGDPYEDLGAVLTCDASARELTIEGEGASLSPGQLLRVEDELIYVTAVDEDGAVAAVRGVNGTSASTHAGANVWLCRYPEAVREAVLITAGRLWKRKDTSYATTIGSADLGQITVYRGLDPDVEMLLGGFQVLRVGAV